MGADTKPDRGQSGIGQPFSDFADGADNFREENTVIEQLGDLPGTRKITKAEAAVPLVQDASSWIIPIDILLKAASWSAE